MAATIFGAQSVNDRYSLPIELYSHALSYLDIVQITRCNLVCNEWHQCIILMTNDPQSVHHRWQPVVAIMKQPLLSWRQLITLQGRQRACDAMILPRSNASSILLRFGTRTLSIGITRAVTPPLPPFPPLPLLPLPHIHGGGGRNRGNNNNNNGGNDVRALLSQLPRYDSLLSLWRQRQRSLRLRLTLFDRTHALSLSLCLLTIIQWYRRRQRHILLLPISIAPPISWSSWRISVMQLASYLTGVALLDLIIHVPSMNRLPVTLPTPSLPSIVPIEHDNNNNVLAHLREPLPHDLSDEKRSPAPSRLSRLQHRLHHWHHRITEWRSRLRYHIRTHDRIAITDMLVQLMNDAMAGIICEIRHRFVMITIFIMGTSLLRKSLRLFVLVDGLRLILKGIAPLLPTLAVMRSLIRGPHRGTALTTWFGGLTRGNLLLSLRSLLIGLTITLKRPHWPHLFTTFIDTIILPSFNNITFGSLMIPLRGATATAAAGAEQTNASVPMMNPLLLHTIIQPSMTPPVMTPISDTIMSSASSSLVSLSSSQQYASASLSSRRIFAVSLMMAMCYYRQPLSLSSYLRPLVRRIRPVNVAPAAAVAANHVPAVAVAAAAAAGDIPLVAAPVAAAIVPNAHDHNTYERRRVLSHGIYIMHSWCMALFTWRLTLRFGLRYAAITHCCANVMATIARQIVCRVMTL